MTATLVVALIVALAIWIGVHWLGARLLIDSLPKLERHAR